MREKIYFQRYTTIYSNNKDRSYIKLYNLLENQKSYNPNELKNKLGISSVKNLAPYQKYLTEQILKSLTNYHWDSSPFQKQQKKIAFIYLLQERGFRKEALKRLKKVKKEAYAEEEFTFLLKVVQLEINLLFQHGILKFKDQLEALQKETFEIIEKLDNIHQLRLLKEQVRELQFHQPYIHLAGSDKSFQFFKKPSLKSIANTKSVKAMDIWYYIQVVGNYLCRDFEQFYNTSKSYLLFYEENRELFPIKQKMILFSNYLYSAAKTKRIKTFQQILEKFKNFCQVHQMEEEFFFYIRWVRSIELYNKTEIKIEVKKLLQELDQLNPSDFMRFQPVETDRMVFYAIRGYIQIEDFQKAHKWLVFWHQIRQQILFSQYVVKLLELIVYYELEYRDLLKSLIPTTSKHWKKLKSYNNFEILVIKYFKTQVKKNPLEKELLELEKLDSELSIIKAIPEQNMIFEEFDLNKWCQSKIIRLKKKLTTN